MDIEKKIDILKEEYFHLQNTIESFDQKALSIKGWSVTLSMAGIGLAFTQSVFPKYILLLAAFASLLFWIIEASWKVFQNSHYKRVEEIEEIFQNETFDDAKAKLSIYKSWDEEHKNFKNSLKYLKILFWPHVCLPHVVVIIAGITLFFIKH